MSSGHARLQRSAGRAERKAGAVRISVHTRYRIEATIEWLIDLLDSADGDPDLEDDDHEADDCDREDDDPGGDPCDFGAPPYG